MGLPFSTAGKAAVLGTCAGKGSCCSQLFSHKGRSLGGLNNRYQTMTRKKNRNKQKNVQEKENKKECVKSGDDQKPQQVTVVDETPSEINLCLKDNLTNEIKVQDATTEKEPQIKDHVKSVDNEKEDEKKEVKSEESNNDKTPNSASILPCSLCQLPCVGPCKKCQAPLCPSCLPFHLYKARYYMVRNFLVCLSIV